MTNTISKRLLAIVLAVVTIFAFTPAIAFTQSAHAVPQSDPDKVIYIGGKEYDATSGTVYGTTDANGTVSDSSSSVTGWNIKWTGTTLTLNGAYINYTSGKAIDYQGSNTIEIYLKGKNSVSGMSAIYNMNAVLTINGDTGGYLKASSTGNYNGIYAPNEITISGGTIYTEATTSTAGYNGISAGTKIKIEGGNVTAKSEAGSGISAGNGTVSISGGTVVASGKSYGIYSNNASSITGGAVYASCTGTGTTDSAFNKTPEKAVNTALDGATINTSGNNITKYAVIMTKKDGNNYTPTVTYADASTAPVANDCLWMGDFPVKGGAANTTYGDYDATSSHTSSWSAVVGTSQEIISSLSLNDYTGLGTSDSLRNGAGIYYYGNSNGNGDITINAEGTNTVIGADISGGTQGLLCNPKMTFAGPGSLNVTAGTSPNGGSTGIACDSSMTVSGGTLTGTGDATRGISDGIFILGGLTVSGGTITGKGGNGKESNGIQANYSLALSGGAVNGIGGTATNGSSVGILATTGNSIMTINSGTLVANGGSATGGNSYGVKDSTSTDHIAVNGGSVEATGTTAAWNHSSMGSITCTTSGNKPVVTYSTDTTGSSPGTIASPTVSTTPTVSALFNSSTYKYLKIEPQAVYTITNTLTNMTTDNYLNYRLQSSNSDYTANLTAANGYTLPDSITVTVGGNTLRAGTDYTYDSTTGALTVNYSAINGNIEITGTGKAQPTPTPTPSTPTYTVEENVSSGDVTYDAAPTQGTDWKGHIDPQSGYDYPDSIVITIGGTETSNYTYNKSTGDITIPGKYVTGTVKITANCVKKSSAPSASKVVMLKTTNSGRSMHLKWTKVSGATKYVVYGGRCKTSSGQKLAFKKLATLGSSKTTYTRTKRTNYKGYKYYVAAYKGSTEICRSLTTHTVVHSQDGHYNAVSIKAAKKSMTLAAGKKATIKATVKAKGGRKLFGSGHCAKVRYVSANPAVAKVSSSGKVTAVKKGTAKIYVIAHDGLWTHVKVTVK